MFKKKRKDISKDTYLETPKRILAILQLCLVFSLVLWYAAQPFMGEYFSLRSDMLLYEYVMGTSDLVKSKGENEKQKLEKNQAQFKALPTLQQAFILDDYHLLQQKASRSMFTKIKQGLRALFIDIPPFELAWIFFAATVAILLLLKTEGAQQAAWLLPFIALCFAFDNIKHGASPIPSAETSLFPTEHTIVQEYLDQPLDLHPLRQQEQLQTGWNAYLIKNWIKENPSTDPRIYQDQLVAAEFKFTVARLEKRHIQGIHSPLNFHERVHPLLLLLYLSWNFFFAWKMNHSTSSLNDSQPRETVLVR